MWDYSQRAKTRETRTRHRPTSAGYQTLTPTQHLHDDQHTAHDPEVVPT